jgi:hypothetical protein
MAINTMSVMTDSSSVYYPHQHQQYRTHYPDILSAPAPVLRDEDILVDGETVAHLPPNSMSFSDYSVVTTTDFDTIRRATAPSSVYDSNNNNNNNNRPPTTIVTASSTSSFHSSSYERNTNNEAMVPSASSASSAPAPSPSTHAMYYYDPYAPATTTTAMATYYEPLQTKYRHVNLPPEVQAMKERRKVSTVAAGVAGGFVGLLVLGPIGAVVGGTTAAVATKQVGKRLEKRTLKKVEARKFAQEEQLYGKPIPALKAVLS